MLQADLLDMLVELHICAVENDALNDPAYLALRHALTAFRKKADFFSFPICVFTITCGKEIPKVIAPEAVNPVLRDRIADIRKRIDRRLVKYVFRQTLSGIAASWLVQAMPKSAVEKEARTVVDSSLEALARPNLAGV